MFQGLIAGLDERTQRVLKKVMDNSLENGCTVQDFADELYDVHKLTLDPELVENVFSVGFSEHYNYENLNQLWRSRESFEFFRNGNPDPNPDQQLCVTMANKVWNITDSKVWPYFPPHSVYCGCSIIGLTTFQLERLGLPIHSGEPINPETGIPFLVPPGRRWAPPT